MKRILIVIHDLSAGGAQKSLLSFLKTLPSDTFQVSLMPIHKEGLFFEQIPKNVNILDSPISLKSLSAPISSKLFWIYPSLKFTILKLFFSIKLRLQKKNQFSFEQNLWKYWGKYIPNLSMKYDVSISYMDGFSNYYVCEKTSAKSKILWVHNDYNKLSASPLFDLPYFESVNSVITISDICKKSLQENFPTLTDKIKVLANISSKRLITSMANEEINDVVFKKENGLKLISIGRLDYQKGFDVAVDVADQLRNNGNSFCWYILGEGSQKKFLKKKIRKLKLDNYFKLIGIKANPYYYISNADIFIQPSRFEGKSIVLDEAKILCKPIVVTNYSTVYDSIDNNKNGIIVDFGVTSLVNGIEEMIKNPGLRDSFAKKLYEENHSNEKEIDKYLKIIDK